MFFIGNIRVVVLRLRDVMMIEIFKPNLGSPMPSSIVKGPKFIDKVWFQSIKTKLYLV